MDIDIAIAIESLYPIEFKQRWHIYREPAEELYPQLLETQEGTKKKSGDQFRLRPVLGIHSENICQPCSITCAKNRCRQPNFPKNLGLEV